MSFTWMGSRHFLGGVAVGAGLTYLLDPEHGAQRRARIRLGLDAVQAKRYGSRLGDIDGLEAANLDAWPGPHAIERLAELAGGLLVAYGLLRRGKTGRVVRALGLGLVATGRRRRAPSPSAERRRTIDIQKSLYIEAPLDHVYAFTTTYANLSLFVSVVLDVRDLRGGRSHWIVSGPDGQPVAWNAVVTEAEPNRLMAWRSEPGSVLDNAGVVRFGAEGTGTRIDFRFCYSPPGTRAGRSLAEFFSADPRPSVNEDVARLKALLESALPSDARG